MTILEVQPLVLKDVIARIGAADADYRKSFSKIEFTPSASSVTWTGLGGNTHTDNSTATWQANLTYVQDWDSADSFSRFLHDHEGETVPMVFGPRTGSGPTFEANIVITPGAIGGTVNAFAETSVALGVDGKPTLVPAVAGFAKVAAASTTVS